MASVEAEYEAKNEAEKINEAENEAEDKPTEIFPSGSQTEDEAKKIKEPRGCAYVFLLYGSTCELYFTGIMVAAWTLIKHRCIHQLVLMYTPDVPTELLDLAKSLGLFHSFVATNYIESSAKFFSNPRAHERFGNIFTKFRVLELDCYEKIIFLDADLFIRGNLDHLFELTPPAAMARGPEKPPMGDPINSGRPINAGLLLLRPDPRLLEQLLADIAEPTFKLQNYNSPDADYLTEHPLLRGRWTSIPLEYNYQLEYDHLDHKLGTVSFKKARGAHFSKEGAALQWSEIQVAHFSGSKPWQHLLNDCSSLLHLQPTAEHCAAVDSTPEESCINADAILTALGEKLALAIGEYARAVGAFQSLCAQLDMGRNILWRQRCVFSTVISTVDMSLVSSRISMKTPVEGRWFKGLEADTLVWAPLQLALPRLNNDHRESLGGDKCDNGMYLELRFVEEVDEALYSGDKVYLTWKPSPRHQFDICSISRDTGMALIKRQVTLPPGWNEAFDANSKRKYYWHKDTQEVRWQFPGLPEGWDSRHDEKTGKLYYYNISNGQGCWDPPATEQIEVPVDSLDRDHAVMADVRYQLKVQAALFQRSFFDADIDVADRMKHLLLELEQSFV